jgi:hypothetical protein
MDEIDLSSRDKENRKDSSSSNRGLASADEGTRERVAHAGGEARAQDKEGLAEAGRKGGEAVVEKYGPEHMAEIGRKGGESVSQDSEHMSEIGKKGGEARSQDKESLSEAGRKGGQR